MYIPVYGTREAYLVYIPSYYGTRVASLVYIPYYGTRIASLVGMEGCI